LRGILNLTLQGFALLVSLNSTITPSMTPHP
jgi:hypothetical protein